MEKEKVEPDYDANDKWGELFRELAEYEFVDDVEAEDVEWLAIAESGLDTMKFVGFEDGPIAVEAQTHQQSGHTYVTDVIETDDSLLVSLVGLGKQLNIKKAS